MQCMEEMQMKRLIRIMLLEEGEGRLYLMGLGISLEVILLLDKLDVGVRDY